MNFSFRAGNNRAKFKILKQGTLLKLSFNLPRPAIALQIHFNKIPVAQ